jgi:hypothetical protein
MCEICAGKTYDDLYRRIHGSVAAGGWALQGVGGGTDGRLWVYSIGLIENFGHPELVITDGDTRGSAMLLNQIGDWIAAGDRYPAGSGIVDDEFTISFGAVHPEVLDAGLCAMWTDYYRWRGWTPGPLEALQVVTETPWSCEHTEERRALARPGAFPLDGGAGRGPNRAQRRARARRSRPRRY